MTRIRRPAKIEEKMPQQKRDNFLDDMQSLTIHPDFGLSPCQLRMLEWGIGRVGQLVGRGGLDQTFLANVKQLIQAVVDEHDEDRGS